MIPVMSHILSPSTAGRSSAQAPSCADLLTTVEEEDALEVHLEILDDFSPITIIISHYLIPHLLGPSLEVILVPRESVDQEVVLLALRHGPLQQGAGDLHRDDGAVSDVMLDQLPELESTIVMTPHMSASLPHL